MNTTGTPDEGVFLFQDKYQLTDLKKEAADDCSENVI